MGSEEQCEEFALCSMNVLVFGILAFGVSISLIVVGSLLSKPPKRDKIDGMTYWNHWAEGKEERSSEKEKLCDMDTISEIEMEHKMSDDMSVHAGSNKTDEKEQRSVIAPLIEEEMETSANINQCRRCMYAICTLSGDDK